MKDTLEAKLRHKYSKILPKATSIDIGDGWYNIVDSLFSCISNNVLNNKSLKITITTVKQKFGYLRIYLHQGTSPDSRIDGMVRLAEELSIKVCEHCGSFDAKKLNSVYVVNLCPSCTKVYCGVKE